MDNNNFKKKLFITLLLLCLSFILGMASNNYISHPNVPGILSAISFVASMVSYYFLVEGI